MILDYFRPKTVNEALELYRSHPNCRFIGGGSSLQIVTDDYRVIDLQSIGLNQIIKENNTLSIGSTTTLEEIYDFIKDIPDLAQALRIEGSKNQRNRATVGGLLMSADGRSPFLTCLVSMDSRIFVETEEVPILLTDFLEKRNRFQKLITKIEIEIPTVFRFESIARSPLDKPIICCAISKIDSQSRVGIGGFGIFPRLITQINPIDIDETQIINQFSIIDDQWASAHYRASLIKTLIKRMSN